MVTIDKDGELKGF